MSSALVHNNHPPTILRCSVALVEKCEDDSGGSSGGGSSRDEYSIIPRPRWTNRRVAFGKVYSVLKGINKKTGITVRIRQKFM